MKISIVGTGYVGLVTGVCFSQVGNDVTCIDIDSSKIEGLKNGNIPIYEPGLDLLVKDNFEANRLHFDTSLVSVVNESDVLFIAVGTPPDEDGSADLTHVLAVAREIGKNLTGFLVVVTKSTVPVGTSDKVREVIQGELDNRGLDIDFCVASNPEFLKEGAAIDDFMKPDRIVVGADDDRAFDVMHQLYAPFNRNHDRLIVMDIRSAELTKYAANAMLATKISFMNELSNLADRLEADIELVRRGMGADPRIGYYFIYPGCGYGGSCFPKDVQALHKIAQETGYDARILDAVEVVNNNQKAILLDKIDAHYGDVKGKKFALWGLAFKPNTDDMREAPSRVVMEGLWERGATVVAYDPVASEEAKTLYPDQAGFTIADNNYDMLKGVDGLIIVTEWQIFKSPDFKLMKKLMSESVIFDGRNICEPGIVKKAGLTYYGIGRK